MKCQRCQKQGQAYDITVPGEGRARLYRCEDHNGPIEKLIQMGEWVAFTGKPRRSQVEEEDLAALLTKS